MIVCDILIGNSLEKLGTDNTNFPGNAKKVTVNCQNVSLSFATAYINNPGDTAGPLYCSSQSACAMTCYQIQMGKLLS